MLGFKGSNEVDNFVSRIQVLMGRHELMRSLQKVRFRNTVEAYSPSPLPV
jgi:hypothetical protein